MTSAAPSSTHAATEGPLGLAELGRALAEGRQAQAATLAFGLATDGALPLPELFGVAAQLGASGQPAQAIALYRSWIAHTVSPLMHAAWFNLAVLLVQTEDLAGAEDAYRSALTLRPDFAEARLNLGTLQERLQQQELALDSWRTALQLVDPARPDGNALRIQALNNLGRLLEILDRYGEAEAMLTLSLELNPQQPSVITHWVHLRQKQCRWPALQPIAGLSADDLLGATSALATLSASGDPVVQLAAARRFVQEKVLHGVAPLAPAAGYVHPRLRIGYLSSDLCSHAVSILTAELFELHDRQLVEVFAFSWSREDGSPLRARVVNAMDHYVRIGGLTDEQAAELIRSHEIDILVDLHGLTLGARPDILSYRPAPVQMTWLGYPGSTGLPEIDYVIADEFVLPPELAPHFSEKPLYLPRCFQINDRQRAIGIAPSRAECGLPEDAFVFCSFNNNHKFTPKDFALWMRILQRVPNAVLWLLADGEEAKRNLTQEAVKAGIGAERLFFAGRVVPAQYLARFRVADLFLDTLPFNAGTTASDALWAGLPLLTQVGRCFAGRMAGSLLRAAGLPELAAFTEEEYEEKAVALAQSPQELAALRRRLAENRLESDLFNSPQFVRDLEAAYLRVARGELRADAGAGAAAARPAGPLVSILLPLDEASPSPLAALDSALAQTYAHIEVVIADSSADARHEAVLAPRLQADARIKYRRKPGVDAADNLQRCLALCGGQFVNVLTADSRLHPHKLLRMLACFADNPDIALVTSSQDGLDAAGQSLPAAPLLPVDTLVTGSSMGQLMLNSQSNPLGSLSAALLRRADADATLGRFEGRRYGALEAAATWLALLSQRGCVYLHEAMSAQAAQAPRAGQLPAMDAAIEWLQLLLDSHRKQCFLHDGAAFHALLAARLAAFSSYTAEHYLALRAARYPVERIQQILRLGYQTLLLDDIPASQTI
ncbi:glycosyltransferase [Massilia sp. BJB1822]|uniref:O-linked N-acetylglucosamine transferase family protein n=1 Tax=Massilia sp. BJB1822 TaxID=2744470 RepID=UPI001594A259|nr:glycosyltransferase [Massilia sp. BJB1822]NVD96459.1 glycosyltransferase [Massilia sp. BJB1822]